MLNLPPELTARQTVSLSKALADPDSFTLFYELVHNEEPARVPELCKTFGAAGSEISRLLSRLVNLGIVEKRGFAYTANEWAADALQFLEESLSTFTIDDATDTAAQISDDDVLLADTSSTSIFGPGTLNGAWTGLTVNAGVQAHSPHLNRSGSAGTGVAEVHEPLPIDVTGEKDASNGTRSHIYK
jgi:hypothetical protein